MSVRNPEGFVRKSTWQVADVRRPLVSASHIIQAGSDLFIGKDEAYIMNRKKKKEEKSMLRKEGDVYVRCDSVLSATNDENDVELNGETDDEEMEDGEMGFDDGSVQERNIRDPGQPTAKELQEHMTTHRPHRSWCKFCVMGRGVNSPHRKSDAQDDLEGVPHVSMDCGFLGERESEEQVSPVLVIRERRHKMTWAMLVPRK